MKQHLKTLNTEYKYRFSFYEEPRVIDRKNYGKKMTRVIYLVFECQDCSHRWTSIAGTFEQTFNYRKRDNHLRYHI